MTDAAGSAPARMAGAGLHAGQAFAAAVPFLISRGMNLLCRGFLVFGTRFSVFSGRAGVMAANTGFFHHGKSFR